MIITSSHMMITVIMTITWTLVHGRQAGDNSLWQLLPFPCHCPLHCTLQYPVQCALHYTVYSEYFTEIHLHTVLHCILHCSIQWLLYCTVHSTAVCTDWLMCRKNWYRKKVSKLVSEKFCTVKSLWTSIKNKTGIVKTWYQTKVSEPVLIFFYRQKSTSIGIKNIYYQRKKKYWYQCRLKLWVQSHSAVHCSSNCSALFTAIVYYIEY